MLAPMGIYLTLTLIACSMILVLCWANDTRNEALETARIHPSVLQFGSHHQARRSHVRPSASKLAARDGHRGWQHRGSFPRTAACWRTRRTTGLAG